MVWKKLQIFFKPICAFERSEKGMILKMNEIKVKSIYKHFKGDLYLVEDIATHS